MIGNILYTILSNDSAINAIIGDRIYPQIIPQGKQLPAISYKVLAINSVDTKDDFTGIEKFRIQIDLYSDSYDQLMKMDGTVRAALNTAEGLRMITDYDDSSIEVDMGVSRHEDTQDVFFDEANTHGRSTEYSIIINKQP